MAHEPANHTADHPASRYRRSRAVRGGDRCGGGARRRAGAGAGGARPFGTRGRCRRGRDHRISGRHEEPAADAGQRSCDRAPCPAAWRRPGSCQEPRAGVERADGGAAGPRPVRDDLSRCLRRDECAEALLQQRHGAGRRGDRQFALYRRPDRTALRHAAPAAGGDPPRRRLRKVRSGADRIRAGFGSARALGRRSGSAA